MLKSKYSNIIGCSLIIAVCVTLCGYALYAGTVPLQLGTEAASQATADRMLTDRKTTIQHLESIVTATINDPAKAKTTQAAMLLLGKLHADEAAPLLVAHLTYAMPHPSSSGAAIHEGLVEDVRPQMVALNDIGLPALPPLLERQMNTDDPEVDNLTYSVLVGMLGSRVALAYVQDAADHQTDPAKRRLLAALAAKIASDAPPVPPLPHH